MRTTPIGRYLAAVSIAGIAVGLVVCTRYLTTELRVAVPAVAVLMLLVVVGELYPIRVPLRDDAEDVTPSTAFMIATLLIAGPALAILAQTVASLASDVRARKPLWKAIFNVAQYALAISAAAIIATTIAPGLCFQSPARFASAAITVRFLAGALAAGMTAFVLNNLFVVVAIALSQRLPILDELKSNLGFHTATTIVLIAQGPLIAMAAARSVFSILLFVPAILAVYQTLRASLVKEYLATHDALTGLPNRSLFRDRFMRAIATEDDQPVVVMIIDLDDFKEVNDTLGHHIGDSLLQQVAQRLTETLRVDDTVARLGGDEFAVVARVRDRDDAEAVGRNILASLHEPFVLQDLPFHIEASVGAAMYPEHARELDGLLQKADVAMYLVKERRSGYETYTASRDRSSPRRLALLGELRRAVEQDELVLHYQPIADLRTGNVVAMEALVRWDHPEHGLLLPDEFIPLAEPTGLMTIMTRRILSLAIAQCRQWRDAGLEPQIAVNISARNLHHDDLIADISAILATHDVPPTALDLEITESAVIADPRRATEILSSLNEIGIETTLDDFGTGHSSLAQLKRLPVKRLKIDQSFVVNMSTDEEDAAIVSSIVELGQNLGLAVVAEGVESSTVWEQLADLGCDFAQGYYLSRPLPPDQMTRWLEHYIPRQSSRPAADVDPQPVPISLVRTISA